MRQILRSSLDYAGFAQLCGRSTIMREIMRAHNRIIPRSLVSNKCIAVRKVATPLRELTCHMGSHSVTCHPAEVAFPPLLQPKLVLD